jgi:hypothetical protein
MEEHDRDEILFTLSLLQQVATNTGMTGSWLSQEIA